MRRYPIAVPLGLFLLLCVASAQQPPRALTGEGLRTAQIPRNYEPPSPTASADDLQQRGDEFRKEKAYGDAVDYYRTALMRTRDKQVQAEIYNKIGIAELQLQHFKEAQKNFQRATKSRHDFAEAYNNLGATYYMQKKFPKAIGEYKKALRMRENDASFHSNLGTAYFMRKEYQLAIAEYSRAFQLDPDVFERTSSTGISAQLSSPENRAQYSYLLAKLYAQAGNFERSILYLRKAMEEGYKEINNVYQDQEFAGLRKDPRFTELMNTKPVAIPE